MIDEPTQQGTGMAPASTAAFYAVRPGGWRDWWNVLHVPYTAWHLAYVVIGASLAPRVDSRPVTWSIRTL